MSWSDDLGRKAQQWAGVLADRGALQHSKLDDGVDPGWRALGENVGYGPDAYLTNVEDDWTVHYSGGTESFHLSGVTSLSQTDYVFA